MEPTQLIVGDTWNWKRTADQCVYLDAAGESQQAKASDGWVLTYALAKSGAIIPITATASGDDHLVSVSAETTAAYFAGVYSWQAYVTKSGERHLVGSGTIKILPNLAAATSGYDNRSHVKKVLDAIDAVIENRATTDQQSYTISGRSLTRIPLPELIKLKQLYQTAYNNELAGEALNAGMGSNQFIQVRF